MYIVTQALCYNIVQCGLSCEYHPKQNSSILPTRRKSHLDDVTFQDVTIAECRRVDDR